MKSKLNISVFLATIALMLIWVGCIGTGTVVVTAKLAPDANGNPVAIQHTTTDFFDNGGEMLVDLTDDADYAEYKDDIKNIDNIGFYAKVKNNESYPVTFQLFLEEDTAANWPTAQMVLDSAGSNHLIFTGWTIPAFDSVAISWNESMQYITGLIDIKSALERGYFSIYPIGRKDQSEVFFDLTVDSMVVIVTLTGSK